MCPQFCPLFFYIMINIPAFRYSPFFQIICCVNIFHPVRVFGHLGQYCDTGAGRNWILLHTFPTQKNCDNSWPDFVDFADIVWSTLFSISSVFMPLSYHRLLEYWFWYSVVIRYQKFLLQKLVYDYNNQFRLFYIWWLIHRTSFQLVYS